MTPQKQVVDDGQFFDDIQFLIHAGDSFCLGFCGSVKHRFLTVYKMSPVPEYLHR